MLTTVKLEKMGATELVFELTGDIFSMSYCGYGNLLCQKIDSNFFTIISFALADIECLKWSIKL